MYMAIFLHLAHCGTNVACTQYNPTLSRNAKQYTVLWYTVFIS